MEGIIDRIQLPNSERSIIKVVGVGGGGGNAVNHMFQQGIKGVTFVVCNTDDQALKKSSVPNKIHLGKNITAGLGAGNKPEVAREAALESKEEIEKMLSDGTKMVFITAGMGGGTGTGAAPVVAEIAQSLGILTVGIVTIPFQFEGPRKIKQALKGVSEMSQHVDALIVIHNDKLRSVYSDYAISNAFAKADDILASAARGIAEIITIEGYINVDFADVNTVMRNGGVAVMNTGHAKGENRITNAINDALQSPLLNNNSIHESKKILLNIYCSKDNEVITSEFDEIHDFMTKMGEDIEVIWGTCFDDTLGEEVKITLIATGSNMNMIPPELQNSQPIQIDDESEDKSQKETHIKLSNSPKTDDSLNDWADKLYPEMNKGQQLKFDLKLEDFDDNVEELNRLEDEPAYIRNTKK